MNVVHIHKGLLFNCTEKNEIYREIIGAGNYYSIGSNQNPERQNILSLMRMIASDL